MLSAWDWSARQHACKQSAYDPFRREAGPEHDYQRIRDLDPASARGLVADLPLGPGEQKGRIDKDRYAGKDLLTECVDATKEDRNHIFRFDSIDGRSALRSD